MEIINVSRIATNYDKIDNEKYDLILNLAASEKGSSRFKYYTKQTAYRKSLEIINSIKDKKRIDNKDSMVMYHRSVVDFDSNTEKQVFINNFLFDDENFAHALEINNINSNVIELLISKIKEKKKEARLSKNYNLNIDDIINIDGIIKYYNYLNKEVMINMMIELYTLKKELLNSKVKKIVK